MMKLKLTSNYISVLSNKQLNTLFENGFIRLSNPATLFDESNIKITILEKLKLLDPFRYEDAYVIVKYPKNSFDLKYKDIISFHPLTIDAQKKISIDYPYVTFSEPLTEIDLDDILFFNRSDEVSSNIDFLQSLFHLDNKQPRSFPHLENTYFIRKNIASIADYYGEDLLFLTLLFDPNDSYPDSDLRYFYRLGELYVMSTLKKQGTKFKESKTYKKLIELEEKESAISLENIMKYIKDECLQFYEHLNSIANYSNENLIYRIPVFLKFRELLESGNYEFAFKLLYEITDEDNLMALIAMVSYFYNHGQLLPLNLQSKKYPIKSFDINEVAKDITSKFKETNTADLDKVIKSKKNIDVDSKKKNTTKTNTKVKSGKKTTFVRRKSQTSNSKKTSSKEKSTESKSDSDQPDLFNQNDK